MLIQNRGRGLGIPVIPIHRAVLTATQDHVSIPSKLHPGNAKAQRVLAEAVRGRSACFWATPCGRGCSIRANYQSTTVHLPPALATGNLDILPRAMAREIILDKNGRAEGVVYVDKSTGKEERVKGRIIVLAAGSGESVRLLLNSKSSAFPHGLANGSGLVGKYLMDTVGASVGGQVPLLESLPPRNEDGAGGEHVYAPWWLYREQLAGKLDFPRGYHIEVSAARGMPDAKTFSNLHRVTGGSYGRQLKADARRYYGSFVNFAGRGNMIPNDNCYCELDPTVKDAWGIPVLRFHWKFTDYEIRQAGHMQKTFDELLRAMGGRPIHPPKAPLEMMDKGGTVIHEVGVTILGSDWRSSVTNRWNQTWEVKDLFIADGGPFCSNADKNPTLTIMALAWRAGDHMLEEMRRGNL